LHNQTVRPVLKEIIRELAGDVEAGFALSQALARHPGAFSEFYVNMVKSAEVTGRLSEVLEYLAVYLEKQSILVGKVKKALIYPAFVIGLFVIVVVIMVTMVLPQLAPVFAEASVELPIFTRILLSSGTFVANWWWIILVALCGILVLLINYFQTEEGKMVMNELSLRAPVVGRLFQKLYLARFAESARVLIKGGLTIPQAIEISSHTIGNYVYRDILRDVAGRIRKGELLSQALKGNRYFPPLISQLIAVGESTGRLEELLSKVSDFYEREVDNTVSNLVELIQPILLVVVGVMVAALFASILLPLYNLTKAF
jgi:type IV pilus assembly protein PilC